MFLRTTVKTVALIAGLALVAQVAVAGSVTGKITYDDKVPTFKPVDMNADPVCASKHSAPVYPEVLVLGDDGGLANVFVQVKNAPAGGSASSEPVIVDQKGCRYEPHVVGVMVGQTVKFKNSDGILHNVHGLPKENREFNIGMPPTLTEKDQVFNKPEAHFPVKCDVHPWMKTYIAVMTHPYFAVTGTDGTFEIADLPAGDYEIEAWHEKLGTKTAKVSIGDGAASADFSFKVPGR